LLHFCPLLLHPPFLECDMLIARRNIGFSLTAAKGKDDIRGEGRSCG
jgi:hypothetical protein